MKLIGLMPVRNEAWVLGLSARVALMWVDALVIYLHACTDNSLHLALDIEKEHPGRVFIVLQHGETWNEMVHRQSMLETARKEGATHIALIDGDEVLTGNLLFREGAEMRDEAAIWIAMMTRESSLLELPGYNLRGGIQKYHSDGIWGRRWFSTAFRDDPELGWHGDRHDHREPMGKQLTSYRPIPQGNGGVMHLWGASERRLIAKHALYKVNHRLRFPEKPIATIEKEFSWAIKGEPGHPSFGTPETWHYNTVPEAWWAPYAHLMKYLDVDAEPWQEAEVQRLVSEYGREVFAGLNLFGVA